MFEGKVRLLLIIMAAGMYLHGAAAAELPAQKAPDESASRIRAQSGVPFPELIFRQSESDKQAMDIHPSLYTEFWKNWHFVSIRWRQDNHEFRFTYANDLAWKTLSEHRTDYPVGAMFGKLIYPSEEDTALPSSVMASKRLNRMEVMMWDPKNKKAGANGWVYLRFINRDPRTPQDKDSTGIWGVMSDKEIKSCVECHNRVYDRGYVFSRPMYLFREGEPDLGVDDVRALSNRYGDSMKDMPDTLVPRIAKDLMAAVPPWKGRPVKGYEGDFFSGSLGEIAPVLSDLAEKDPKYIYMIYDKDSPDTIELASAVPQDGYDRCVGHVTLRSTAMAVDDDSGLGGRFRRKRIKMDGHGNTVPLNTDLIEGEPDKGLDVTMKDLRRQFQPYAMLYITCGSEAISRQALPLDYKDKDADGLPSYHFVPAVLDPP